MYESLTPLVFAAAVFVLSHFGLASTPLRAVLVARLGALGYQALFSLVAFVAIGILVHVYQLSPLGPFLWEFGRSGAIAATVFMPIACFLFVGALSPSNPTLVGAGRGTDGPRARSILRITRHPMLWSFGLWAIAHLLATGDSRSVIFFGSFAILAVVGTVLIDLRYAAAGGSTGKRYQAFLVETSNVPLLAVMTGRQSLPTAAREFGVRRLAVVVGLYALMVHFHAWLFGAYPFPV